MDIGRNHGCTRRTQLLMEHEEYKRLEPEARRRKTSVAALIRSAVHEACFEPVPDRTPIVEEFLGMNLPTVDWKRARKEIEEGHANVH